MVNSGSFDSDVDRNEKGEITQPRRVAESPQSMSSVYVVSGSLCEDDFSTQTADSLPPVAQAIEPTATKTEYKCNMSELLLRAGNPPTSKCVLEDLCSNGANHGMYDVHATPISSNEQLTEVAKCEGKLTVVKENLPVRESDRFNKLVGKCKLDKILNKDGEIETTKVSVCCSVPLAKVQDILKVCSTSASGGNSSIQTKKQTLKKDICLYCDRTFVTSSLKQRHVDRYHSLKHNRRLSRRRQAAKHSLTACMFCDKLNDIECTLRHLFEHLVTEHPKKYFGCLDCETRFASFQILETHINSIHGGTAEPTVEQNSCDLICNKARGNIAEKNLIEKFTRSLNTKSKEEHKEIHGKTVESEIKKLKTVENKASSLCGNNILKNSVLFDTYDEYDKQKSACLKNKHSFKSKSSAENKKGEEEKRNKALPTLSVALEPIKVSPYDKASVVNENKFFVKEKSKMNWTKELRSKKVSVVSTKMGIKQCVRITRQQSKTLENAKNSKRRVKTNKNDDSNKTSIATKYLSFQNHPYTAFDFSFRVKKITDHSIDNIKISSMTFDDVFDKAFFTRVKCNIQENLLNFIDGKLFKNVESENRISSFQKSNNLQTDEANQNYGCKISANAVTPFTAPLLTDSQFGEDIESQIEYGSKPSKKKATTSVVNDEVHYKYFTRRKYQAVISENRQHRDLSKLDMWTQLAVKNRQQKILCEQKTDKEILEYKKSDEYKVKMQVEELDRILDKRGPLEDLKEEAIRTVALEKLNGTAVDTNIESYFDVTIILNELLNSLFTVDTPLEITGEDVENGCTSSNNCEYSSEISSAGEEMPAMLNLRRISHVSHENTGERTSRGETGNSAMMELTGEWARSRIYVCASCGIKMPNAKLLLDHKNLFHEHVWCQHYEFVGNQGELYRHLSIPGLGKVGEIESSGSKMWRRSDARTCSKCNKRFNCLGDLHRHVLECGGDWSWMLARKKYKYRPYGSKTRKRRRGLLKFLHAFRERKREQATEKGKTIKKFDGPRQKPSDADTIQRMLANLPAKRITRKMISLKDGLQRSIKKQKISETNKNKSLRQKKMQVNKTSQKNKNVVNNQKKSRRLLRSNSNIMFENKINLMLPKFKKDRKEVKKNANSNVRRHSVKNISRVLTKKLVKTNAAKLRDAQENVVKTSETPPNLSYSKGDPKKKTVAVQFTNKSLSKEIGGKKSSKTSDQKKTVADLPPEKACRKKKHTKKETPTACEMTESSTPPQQEISQNIQNTVIPNHQLKGKESWKKDILNQKKIKFRSANGKFSKKHLCDIERETVESQSAGNNIDQSTLNMMSKLSSNRLKNSRNDKRKVKFSHCNDGIPKNTEISCENNRTKNNHLVNLRKFEMQSEPKNVDANIRTSYRRKNIARSKAKLMAHNMKSATKKLKLINVKKTITKIIQVDGSSQNKPSGRSKCFRKEFPQTKFLLDATSATMQLNSFSKIIEGIPQLPNVDEAKVVPEINPELNGNPSDVNVSSDLTNLSLATEFTESLNPIAADITRSNTVNADICPETNNTKNLDQSIVSESTTGTSSVPNPQETEKPISNTNSVSLATRPVMKRKVNKKQRGLNDCIAMLTNKLQHHSVSSLNSQNSESTFFTSLTGELPNGLALTECKVFPKKSEEKSCDLEENVVHTDNCTAKGCLKSMAASALEFSEEDDKLCSDENCKKNKENFELQPQLVQTSNILTPANFTGNFCQTSVNTLLSGEQLNKSITYGDYCKIGASEELQCEDTVIYNCISPISTHDNIKDRTDDILCKQKLISDSKVEVSSSSETDETKNQLEIQKSQKTIAKPTDQYHLKFPEGDMKASDTISDPSVICKSETTSSVTDVKQKTTEVETFHNVNKNSEINSVSKCQTEESKFRKQKVKRGKKKLEACFQNSKKCLKSKNNDYADKKDKLQKPESIINDSKESFSELTKSIAASGKNDTKTTGIPDRQFVEGSTESDQTVMSSTSEEFSNSGKENELNIGMKYLKPKKIKHCKGISRKNTKKHETPADYKGIVKEAVLKHTKLDIPGDLIADTSKISGVNEFVDSEDDIPLAQFVKRFAANNITNDKSSTETCSNCGPCERPLHSADQAKTGLPIILEDEVLDNWNSGVDREDYSEEVSLTTSYNQSLVYVLKEEMSNENLVISKGKTRHKAIAVTSHSQNRENVKKKAPKLSTNNKKKEEKLTNRKNKKYTRRKKVKNSGNRIDTSSVLTNVSNTTNCHRLCVENITPAESVRENILQAVEKYGDQNNDSYSKIAVKPLGATLNKVLVSEIYSMDTHGVVNDALCSNINTEIAMLEKYKNQGDSKQNYPAQNYEGNSKKIPNDLNNEVLHKYETSENQGDTNFVLPAKDEKYKKQANNTVDSLNAQVIPESSATENGISQEDTIMESASKNETSKVVTKLFDSNSSVLTTNYKPKPRPRLKTVFRNKKNVNIKKNSRCQNANNSNTFCDICKKTFTRSENLLKHKRTLTHIAKLSELEALQAAEISKQGTVTEENEKQNCIADDRLEIGAKDNLNSKNLLHNVNVNVNVSLYDEYQKSSERSTFALSSAQDSLKLVDIISDVLSKPIDGEFIKHGNFSDIILQSDREIKRCKSLGERKSFDSDKLQLFTNTNSPTPNMDVGQKFVVSKLSNTADIIVEKQISLLENMIEDNRINYKSAERMFSSSNLPANEEYSDQSSSSQFSILSSCKQEDCNDITFTHNTNIITNLIRPTLDEDNLIQSAQYEEISEDSSSSRFQVEEQKSRKALNRDEELFLECCSLLKSSSDVSDLCKKPAKSAQFLNHFGLKPLDHLEWFEQKQLPTQKSTDFEYVANNFVSDDSHTNASVNDNLYDLSYSNSNMSNSNLNLKALLNRNESNFFSQPPIFEDISTESGSSSAKSLGSGFKAASPAIMLNGQDSLHDTVPNNNHLSPNVESAQIPEEFDINGEIVEEREKNVLKCGDTNEESEKKKIDLDLHHSLNIEVPQATQASVIDYAAFKKTKKSQNKKMLTKGAMKVFEGLKVSIPKNGLDMKEVLNCSPTSKRLQLEAEEESVSVSKKLYSAKVIKRNSKFNKLIDNNVEIKKTGNKLGLKITKKKYSSNPKSAFKMQNDDIMKNKKKSHDIYDFEETQDNIDVFTNSSNSLPVYRSFRNKLLDTSDDISRTISSCKKKSYSEPHNENEKDESLLVSSHINNRCISDEKSSSDMSSELGHSSKKIDMCKSITKKKCMIMGRIFKNAVKSKIGDEIKNIPTIENSEIVENFVLNCQEIQSDENEIIGKEHKLSEEEMNILFDNLLNEEKSRNTTNKKDDQNDELMESRTNSFLITKNVDNNKAKHKINRCKKRPRGNSSDASDEEFSIKKTSKRQCNKKSGKNNECVINLEQELKECIGVASRKSQRKCTSGKQNVLVEYWSSDESNFDTDAMLNKHLEDTSNFEEEMATSFSENIESKSIENMIIGSENQKLDLSKIFNDTPDCNIVSTSNLKKKTKEIGKKQFHKLTKSHNANRRILKTDKNIDISPSGCEVHDCQTIASCRKKRRAVDTLYYWSSSSEDELQDVIEIKPVREEYDDEDRPLQHGWIVGDSPKKLVTMLAQAKGKKLDVESVKKNKKKRTV